MIRVLLADDEGMIRSALAALLRVLDGEGEETRVVGGAVLDSAGRFLWSGVIDRAEGTLRLDDPATRSVTQADPSTILLRNRPLLVDEWQHVPAVWDVIRHSVDDDPHDHRDEDDDEASPPQAGLMGAIHSRHTSTAPGEQPRPARPASAAAPPVSSPPTPLWPQQQMMMHMYYWQQQQMMMMGMMPYMSRENMIAQQQAMQAAQQAYYQAYMQYAPSSAMPTPASSPGMPSMPMMPMMPMPMMDGSMPMMPTSSSSASHGSAARDSSAPSQRSSTAWDAPKSKSPPPPMARTHRA